jgi:hypothetical protein
MQMRPKEAQPIPMPSTVAHTKYTSILNNGPQLALTIAAANVQSLKLTVHCRPPDQGRRADALCGISGDSTEFKKLQMCLKRE